MERSENALAGSDPFLSLFSCHSVAEVDSPMMRAPGGQPARDRRIALADLERALDLARVVAVPGARFLLGHAVARLAPLAGQLVFQFPEPELNAIGIHTLYCLPTKELILFLLSCDISRASARSFFNSAWRMGC